MFGFGGNLVSKAPIEHFSGFAHASSGAENEWSEGSQLNFVDPLLIQAPFDSFMMGITDRDEKPLVGWCVWVEYLDIKKCTLVRGSPESFGLKSALAPLSVIADAYLRVCSSRGYSVGSTVTS